MSTRESDRIRELESEVENLHVTQAIESAARGLALHPEHVARVIDRGGIRYDPETREVSGARAVVEKFLTANPSYAVDPRFPTGPPAPSGSPPSKPRRGAPDPYDSELRAMGKGGRM